jgi:hypothetical protein
MAKVPMRVIPEPAPGTREVLRAISAGSKAVRGMDGRVSFLCGNCRDLLAMDVYWDTPIVFSGVEPFLPLLCVSDLVFQCKNCGAFNETWTHGPGVGVGKRLPHASSRRQRATDRLRSAWEAIRR